MASTYTSITRLEKQGDGENPNTWGARLNQNALDLVDQAIGQYTTISVAAANYTLTVVNGGADQARSPFIELQGTVTSSLNVVVPALGKSYVINDTTTRSPSSRTITLKTATGSGQLVKSGRISQFICDSVSVHPVEGYSSVTEGAAGLATNNTFTGTNIFSNTAQFNAAVNFSTNPVSVYDLRTRIGDFENIAVSAAAITHVSVNRGILTPTSLSGAGTITMNLFSGQNFLVTLTGNRTLANPTSPTAGQTGLIYVRQDGTGSRTLAFGSSYNFSGGTAPTLSTNANAVDLLAFSVRTTSEIDVVFTPDFR